MSMYFKLAPGVRVRVGKRGVRTSIGPRAARVHVGGGYRAGVSTGAGPFTLYKSVGAARRRSATPTRAAAGGTGQGATKAQQAQAAAAALGAINDLHRHPVDPVSPPVAPPAAPVDQAPIRRRHAAAATAGLPFWKLGQRRTARRRALADADAEVAAATVESEAQRSELQRHLDRTWAELLANDADVVIATLTEAFEAHGTHAAALAVDGAEASVAVVVPGTEVVPERWPSVTAAGNPSLARTTLSQAAGTYTTAVCGQVLAVVREVLAVAPGLASVRVAAVRASDVDAYGARHAECLLAATVPRRALQGIDWVHAASPTIFDQVATGVELRLAGRVKHLEPVDLAEEPDLAALVAAIDIDHEGVGER